MEREVLEMPYDSWMSKWYVGRRVAGKNRIVQVSPDYPSKTAAKRRIKAANQGHKFKNQRKETDYTYDSHGEHRVNRR
jgi:hypothetical protein